MKKNKFWLLALLLPFLGMMSSCSEDDIVFDHELPQFEIQQGKILLEVIVPQATNAADEIYIAGAFNGGEEAAVDNPTWALQKSENTNLKWGIYLDPATFEPGTSLADGFYFVSKRDGREYTVNGTEAIHTDNPKTGTRTNIFADRWASYYGLGPNQGGEEEEGPDYYIPYLDSEDEIAVFFETDATNEYVRIWAWGGEGEAACLGIESNSWDLRPNMELVGQTESGRNVFKFVFKSIPESFLVSISDADGNQIGSDDDRPIKGAAYVVNGYYIDGVDYGTETPEVITQVGKPAGGGSKKWEPTLDSEDETAVFFETDATNEYVRIWAWGGEGEAACLGIESNSWDLRPNMELVGQTESGRNVFKFVFKSIPESFLVSISDADGNQIGSDDDRPIKGAAYVVNGYYIDGVDYSKETPEVITKVAGGK